MADVGSIESLKDLLRNFEKRLRLQERKPAGRPHVTAALIARIEDLEDRVTALENQ